MTTWPSSQKSSAPHPSWSPPLHDDDKPRPSQQSHPSISLLDDDPRLKHPAPIDWTQYDANGQTSLHIIVQDYELVRDVLPRVLQRLTGYPKDTVDWSQRDHNGNDCLSTAAHHGTLAHFWEAVKEYRVPYFLQRGGARIRIHPYRVHADPYKAQPKAKLLHWDETWLENCGELQRFETDGVMGSTESLYHMRRLPHPDPEAVACCVSSDADVQYRETVNHLSALESFVRLGHTDAVAACLQTMDALDFTVADINNNTLLHSLCSYEVKEEAATAILRIIVDRLMAHPEDTVDFWLRNNDGADFLSLAASNQRLSAFWRVVKNMPAYADCADPIPLTGMVWEWDWAELSHEEQQCLTVTEDKNVQQTSKETGRLWALVISCAGLYVDIKLMLGCVGDGADVLFLPSTAQRGFLHELVYRGDVNGVRACLDAVKGKKLDLSRAGADGQTLLHLAAGSMTTEKAEEMTCLLLAHLKSHGGEGDLAALLGQEDSWGQNVLTYAAFCHRVAAVVRAIRACGMCANIPDKIFIDTPMDAADMDQVTKELAKWAVERRDWMELPRGVFRERAAEIGRR